MPPFAIAILIAVALIVTGLVLDRLGVPFPGVPRPGFRHTVVVHTQDGQSIRGVLLENRHDHLLLIEAELLETTENTISLGGQAVVLKANVSWMQLVSE